MTGIIVSEEARAALEAGHPVVALESTIIAHGLPRPRNLEVALELEATLRQRGVVPATVGVIDGVATVGVTRDELELLATSDAVEKASVRDLPLAMATGRHAATTVAATAVLARRAGIRVFATGGIGGVHRQASQTFDESADLPTLARTPITVVCAGVKSVLDIGATVERMETLGITLLGYRTNRLPGFLVADSGHPLEACVDGPLQVAATMRAADALGLTSAVVVAAPVPQAHQLDPAEHGRLLSDALAAAASAGAAGKAVTPFLLDHLQRASGGATLAANVAAVRNNVAIAAEIAVAWAA